MVTEGDHIERPAHDQLTSSGGIMRTRITKFTRNDKGATAVEYGLMVALIAAVIIAGVTLIGLNLNALFTGVAGLLVLPA
jgi:pilus assembly protein Flp/PilA